MVIKDKYDDDHTCPVCGKGFLEKYRVLESGLFRYKHKRLVPGKAPNRKMYQTSYCELETA